MAGMFDSQRLVRVLISSAFVLQDVEVTLHCLKCASEAVELGEEKVLPVLFSTQVFGRLPRDPEDAVYLTAIRLIRK